MAEETWKIGSVCMVFSKTDNKWYAGEIENIIDESINEWSMRWFIVRYKNNTKTMKIKSNSKYIKPISLTHPVSLKIGSKCKIRSDKTLQSNKTKLSKDIHQAQYTTCTQSRKSSNKANNKICSNNPYGKLLIIGFCRQCGFSNPLSLVSIAPIFLAYYHPCLITKYMVLLNGKTHNDQFLTLQQLQSMNFNCCPVFAILWCVVHGLYMWLVVHSCIHYGEGVWTAVAGLSIIFGLCFFGFLDVYMLCCTSDWCQTVDKTKIYKQQNGDAIFFDVERKCIEIISFHIDYGIENGLNNLHEGILQIKSAAIICPFKQFRGIWCNMAKTKIVIYLKDGLFWSHNIENRHNINENEMSKYTQKRLAKQIYDQIKTIITSIDGKWLQKITVYKPLVRYPTVCSWDDYKSCD